MEYTRKQDTVTVKLSGELDHCSAQGIRRELDQLLEEPGVKKMVLDMKNMSFMDSSGIGVILGRYRVLAQRGGKMAVKNMNEHVKRIFILSGMNLIIGMM